MGGINEGQGERGRVSIWAHGALGGQVDECWVGECMGTCSVWAVKLLFPKAASRFFRILLESEKLGGSRIKIFARTPMAPI